MAQSLSARHSANKKKLAQMITQAKRLYTLYDAEMAEDSPKSRTVVNISPSSQKGIKPLDDPSLYQTKSQCVAAIISKNPAMSSVDAGNYCDTIYGNAQKMALKKKQALILNQRDQAYQDCLATGESVTQCTNQMNQLYPLDIPSPQKSASVPYHVVVSDIPTNHIHSTNNLRSASEIPDHWIGESIQDMRIRKAREHENRITNSNQKIKSSSSEIPYWAQISCADVI